MSRTFTVKPRPEVVVDYLADFTHAEEWDPGTESCTRLDSGPIRVGSRFHNESKIAGVSTELVYELVTLDADKVVLRGENDSATSTDTITVVELPRGAGSEITYEAVIEAKGVGKLAEPLMKLVFERIGSETEEKMTEALDGLAG